MIGDDTTVIDANGQIMGRLASCVAKRLLAGENIVIVNAEKCIISGSRVNIYGEYKEMRDKGSKEKGPYFPRMPDRILKRTVRGMLPYKRAGGRDAMSRLRVYMGIPEEYAGAETVTVEEASVSRLGTAKYVSLGDVSRKLGGNIRGD